MDTLLKNYSRITNNLVHRVNDTRGLGKRTRDSLISKKDRVAFLETLKLTTQQGLTAGLMSEGSVRLRIAEHFMCTKLDAWFAQLDENDLVLANRSQIIDGAKLPNHIQIHHQLYQQNSDIKAVLLSQPSAVMAFLVKGTAPTIKLKGLSVSLCFDSVRNFTSTTNALFISDVGLFTVGESIQKAAARAEAINRLCQIELQQTGR